MLAAALALLPACGDRAGSDVASLPIFDGVGDFYDVPDPLPEGEPGELIRVQPVTLSGHEERGAMRVMYHSRDSQGRDIAATGVVTYPLADAIRAASTRSRSRSRRSRSTSSSPPTPASPSQRAA